MSITALIVDLANLGIRLEAHGDRLRYTPKSAMTPVLAERVNAHKVAMLAFLSAKDPSATLLWQTALGKLKDDPECPRDLLAAADRASVASEGRQTCDDVGKADEAPGDTIEFDPPDPCPGCGGIEVWQNFLGDWFCEKCHPPHPRSDEWWRHSARLRKSPKMNIQGAEESTQARFGATDDQKHFAHKGHPDNYPAPAATEEENYD